MQLYVILAYNLLAAPRRSTTARPGYEIHPGPGYKNPLCGICQGRQLCVDRWAQHSWAWTLPARCQELDWRSHGEAGWHFFTPMCLISVATSRHVRQELHSPNATRSNWHVGLVMTYWEINRRVWIQACVCFFPIKQTLKLICSAFLDMLENFCNKALAEPQNYEFLHSTLIYLAYTDSQVSWFFLFVCLKKIPLSRGLPSQLRQSKTHAALVTWSMSSQGLPPSPMPASCFHGDYVLHTQGEWNTSAALLA